MPNSLVVIWPIDAVYELDRAIERILHCKMIVTIGSADQGEVGRGCRNVRDAAGIA